MAVADGLIIITKENVVRKQASGINVSSERKNDDSLKETFTFSDSIIIADRETGRIIDCNKETWKLYCCSMEKLKSIDIYSEMLNLKGREELDLTGRFFGTVCKQTRLDGSIFYAEITAAASVVKGRDAIIMIIKNIVQTKQVEVEIINSSYNKEEVIKNTTGNFTGINIKSQKEKIKSIQTDRKLHLKKKQLSTMTINI